MAGTGQVQIQLPQAPLPIVPGTEAWKQTVEATSADLSGDLVACSVPLSVLPKPSGGHDIVILKADSSTLIALCQESLGSVLSAVLQRPSSVAVTGVYDCDTATNMVAIGDLVGADTAASIVWPLGARELSYLLSSSARVQRLVTEALPQKTGGAIALQPGFFAPALPPSGCDIPVGTNGTSGGAAVVGYGDQPEPVSGNGPKKTGGWWPFALLGAAGGAIVLLAYTGSTQRRGNDG